MRRWYVLVGVLILTLFLVGPRALADEKTADPVITLDKAIKMALERDESFKMAEAEVDRTQYLRDAVAEKISFIPLMGATYDPTFEKNWYEFLQADLNWQMSKKSLEVARDALVVKVSKAYWDVQVAEEELKTKKLAEQQALLNLQNARIGFLVGTVSRTDVITAEERYEQAKAGVLAAQHALDDAYNAFNRLIGLDPGQRPILVDAPSYEPIEVTDIDAEVGRIVESSPTIWLAEQQITLKKWTADMAFYTGQYTPYKARQVAIEQAELDAANRKNDMKMKVKSLYFQIKGLEEKYRVAERELKLAWEGLRVTRTKYELGMATKAEVVAKEVEVAKAQQQLDSLVRQHAYLKLAFEKPWAMSGSGSSTSSSGGQEGGSSTGNSGGQEANF